MYILFFATHIAVISLLLDLYPIIYIPHSTVNEISLQSKVIMLYSSSENPPIVISYHYIKTHKSLYLPALGAYAARSSFLACKSSSTAFIYLRNIYVSPLRTTEHQPNSLLKKKSIAERSRIAGQLYRHLYTSSHCPF